MKKNKKLIMAMAVALAMTTVVCATFAWFTAKDSVVNHLESARLTDGDVEILEIWEPEDGKEWTPDKEVNKDVGAINTGSADAFVRISFEEVLNRLFDAVPRAMATPWTSTQQVTIATVDYDVIPQLVNTAAYSGWTSLTTTSFAGGYSIPSGVTIKYKETTVGTDKVYNFAAYYQVDSTTFQKVDMPDAKITVVDVSGTPTPTLSLGNLEYQVLAVNPEATADWVAAKRAAADLAKSVLGDDSAARMNTWALTDGTNKFIRLIFTNFVKTSTTLSAYDTGDWFYDAVTGWFYYVGILKSGTATANNLLDALYLSEEATSVYSNMNFDLLVKMEAIQATAEALDSTAGGGWGLSTTSTAYLLLVAELAK